jgi:hypothetical protein
MQEEKLAALTAHEAYSTAKHTNIFFSPKKKKKISFVSSFNDEF